MPTYFPCPNTRCGYQFDADILPPAALVTCPLCRTRFPYRANRAAPAQAGPVAPAHDADGPRVVHLREVPKGGGILTTVLMVGGFVLVLTAVLAAIVLRGQPTRTPDPVAAKTDATFNVAVEPFPQGWAADPSPPGGVDANVFVRKRTNPDGWVAVAAKDWADREPRAAEVSEFKHGRLRAFRTLEAETLDGQTWAGHPTQAIRFAATLDDAQVRGEAYSFSHKGVGYVFYAWAAEADWDHLRDELVALREKVKPADFRDRWVAKQANVRVYEGPGYQIEDRDGVWVQARPATEWKDEKVKYAVDDVTEIDPAATMAFLARYQIKERGDALRLSPEAKALVVELEGKGSPLEVAMGHVVARAKRDFAGEAPDLTLEVVEKSPSGAALPTGGPAIGRFRLKNPKATGDEEVWVVSAIAVGDKVVAVEAHVLEKYASYVDEWMVHLAGSLKAK